MDKVYSEKMKKRIEEAVELFSEIETYVQGEHLLTNIEKELKADGLTMASFLSDEMQLSIAANIENKKENYQADFNKSTFVQILKSTLSLSYEIKTTPMKDKIEEHRELAGQLKEIGIELDKIAKEIENKASASGNQFNAMAKKGGNIVDFIAFGDYGDFISEFMNKINEISEVWEKDKAIFSKDSETNLATVEEKLKKQQSRKTGKMSP